MSKKINVFPSKLGVTTAYLMALAGQSGVAAAQDGQTYALEEIVVSAQRRVETVQDVPVSVTAVTGDQMEESRVFNVENIQALTPSITFRKSNIATSSANIQIRGIGTSGNSRTFEGAVGVFVDGVYRSRSAGALTDFLDIGSLQVLRGAQGTLFGKNTSAGAILVNSNEPQFDYEGMLSVEYGDNGHRIARGTINVPVAETSAFRLSAIKRQRDGFYDAPGGGEFNDADSSSYKLQFYTEPTDNLSAKFIVDYSNEDVNCCYGTVNLVDGPTQPLVDGLAVAFGNTPASSDMEDRESSLNSKTKNEVTDKGFTLHLAYEADAATIKYIGAIRKYELVQEDADSDFSAAPIFSLDEDFESEFSSHEITISGELDSGISATYVVGAYYSSEELEMGRNIYWEAAGQAYWDTLLSASAVPAGTVNAAEGLFSTENMEAEADSQAIFTHWDFELSDEFNLIIGARYSKDEKRGAFSTGFFRDPLLDPFAFLGLMPGVEYDEDYDDSSVSGSVAIQYRPQYNTMYYFSYNKGYKAGGINIDVNAGGTPGSPVLPAVYPAVLGSPSFESETIDSYELGAKIDWLNGSARTNVALFYSDLEDLQVAQFLGLVFNILNAKDAKVYGGEVEQTWRLSESLTFSSGITYLAEAAYGDDDALGDLKNRDFSVAPEIAANAALRGEHSVLDGLWLRWNLEAIYTDEHYTATDNDYIQGDSTIINASIGLGSDQTGLSAQLWGQNLTDRTTVARSFNTPLQTGDLNAYLNDPRIIGVTVKYEF